MPDTIWWWGNSGRAGGCCILSDIWATGSSLIFGGLESSLIFGDWDIAGNENAGALNLFYSHWHHPQPKATLIFSFLVQFHVLPVKPIGSIISSRVLSFSRSSRNLFSFCNQSISNWKELPPPRFISTFLVLPVSLKNVWNSTFDRMTGKILLWEGAFS